MFVSCRSVRPVSVCLLSQRATRRRRTSWSPLSTFQRHQATKDCPKQRQDLTALRLHVSATQSRKRLSHPDCPTRRAHLPHVPAPPRTSEELYDMAGRMSALAKARQPGPQGHGNLLLFTWARALVDDGAGEQAHAELWSHGAREVTAKLMSSWG